MGRGGVKSQRLSRVGKKRSPQSAIVKEKHGLVKRQLDQQVRQEGKGWGLRGRSPGLGQNVPLQGTRRRPKRQGGHRTETLKGGEAKRL